MSLETVNRFARLPNSIAISCELDLNLNGLLQRIWKELDLHRIYTKRRGEPPDLDAPLVVRQYATVKDVTVSLRSPQFHCYEVEKLKYLATSGRYSPWISGEVQVCVSLGECLSIWKSTWVFVGLILSQTRTLSLDLHRAALPDSSESVLSTRHIYHTDVLMGISPQPQKVGLTHMVASDDVITIFTK